MISQNRSIQFYLSGCADETGSKAVALGTFVYIHAALRGLISIGLRLNEEADVN